MQQVSDSPNREQIDHYITSSVKFAFSRVRSLSSLLKSIIPDIHTKYEFFFSEEPLRKVKTSFTVKNIFLGPSTIPKIKPFFIIYCVLRSLKKQRIRQIHLVSIY